MRRTIGLKKLSQVLPNALGTVSKFAEKHRAVSDEVAIPGQVGNDELVDKRQQGRSRGETKSNRGRRTQT